MFDYGQDGDEPLPDAVIRSGGPRSVQHLLLSLSPENPLYLYADAADAGGGAYYRDSREVWQSLADGEGQRWRWFVGSQGRVVEAAPGDVHGLRRAGRSPSPSRGTACRTARASGGCATPCAPSAQPAPAARRAESVPPS